MTVWMKDKGGLYTSLPCEYGRVTIGFFNNILHDASKWEGIRGSIALNLKKVLNSLEIMAQVSMINIEEMDIHQVNIQFINLFFNINKILQTVLLL